MTFHGSFWTHVILCEVMRFNLHHFFVKLTYLDWWGKRWLTFVPYPFRNSKKCSHCILHVKELKWLLRINPEIWKVLKNHIFWNPCEGPPSSNLISFGWMTQNVFSLVPVALKFPVWLSKKARSGWYHFLEWWWLPCWMSYNTTTSKLELQMLKWFTN